MKRRFLFINWLFIGLILFHLPFGHMALKGFILCIGADGQLNIENACAQPESVTQLRIEKQEKTTPQNQCGACVDLPLDLDCKENLLNNPTNQQFKFFGLKGQPLSHSPTTFKSPKYFFKSFDDIDNPPLKSLSTTILLI